VAISCVLTEIAGELFNYKQRVLSFTVYSQKEKVFSFYLKCCVCIYSDAMEKTRVKTIKRIGWLGAGGSRL
jgi:hypothetical protein